MTLVPNAHEINADLTWRQEQEIEEPVDVFLNGRTAAQGGTNVDITTLEHLYPTLKSVAFSIGATTDNRLRIAPFEGGLRFLGDVDFDSSRTNSISGTTGAFIIRLQDSNTGVGVVPILNFTTLPGTGGHAVDWTVNTRTFDAAITIISGVHSNFPLDWSNGLTFGGAVTLARPAVNTELDWTNVVIPDGTTVTFPGTDAIAIRGLTVAERGRVVGANIQFVDNPIENTLRIPAQAGWLAMRLRDSLNRDDEAVAQRRFTAAEITAGEATFILSDQTSINGTAFSNLVAGDFYEIFVKYDSTPDLLNSVVYQEQYQQLAYNATADGTILSFTQTQQIPLTLVSAAAPVATGDFVVSPADGAEVGTVGLVQLTNPIDDISFNPLPNGQTLSGAIQLGNFDVIFQSFYDNRAVTTDPIVVYGQGNISRIDGRRVTIRSGNRPGTPVFIQHIVSGWEAQAGTTLFPTTNGVVEIINNSPGLAIVPVDNIVDGTTVALQAQGLTRNNIGNLGLLAPALDADGTVIPVTPPGGG